MVSVETLLQHEIIIALETGPVIDLLDTTETSGVVPCERLDSTDGYDPGIGTHIMVEMPVLSDIESICAEAHSATASCNLFIRRSQFDHREADIDMKTLINNVRVSLAAASYTSNMRRIGGYRSAASINEGSWGTFGQDMVYKMTIKYALKFPSSGLVPWAVIDGGDGGGFGYTIDGGDGPPYTDILDGGT